MKPAYWSAFTATAKVQEKYLHIKAPSIKSENRSSSENPNIGHPPKYAFLSRCPYSFP